MKITPFVLSAALFCAASAISQTGGGTGSSGSSSSSGSGVSSGSGSANQPITLVGTAPASQTASANLGTTPGAREVKLEAQAIQARTNQFLSTNALFGTNGLPPSLTNGPPTRLFGPPR